MKKALITGIAGQDGSYLAELLLEKGYHVHGMVRSCSSYQHIRHLCDDPSHKERFTLHRGDLGDAASLQQILNFVRPDEVYNLAGESHMLQFAIDPEQAADVAAMGVLRLLEAVKNYHPSARVFQAASSELFGKPQCMPQSETTPFSPCSFYGITKQYAFGVIVHYRQNYQLFGCNGILFNHESPRRRDTFVSRKITQAVVRIQAGIQEKLVLGNLDSERDWGYAKDFAEGMWKMLQHDQPEDFVLATGRMTTVREFVELAFLATETRIIWSGSGIDEKGYNESTGKVVVEVSPDFFRPAEPIPLIGDPSKAKTKLGWIPKTSLEELVSIMVQADRESALNLAKNS